MIVVITLAALILGFFSGLALMAPQGSPRFPVNVTLGPVSPPPGASFTPKYPGEFKATPPPGLNITMTPTAKATVTGKPKATVKPTVKPTVTIRRMKVMKPSPSVTTRPRYAEAYNAAVRPSVKPVVPTVSIRPTKTK